VARSAAAAQVDTLTDRGMGGLISRANRFRRLGAGQRGLTLGAAVWLATALALRRCLPAEKLFALAAPEDGTQAHWDMVDEGTRRAITQRKAALARACRALHITNCLVRATALGLALRQAGIGSTLHIGVRKTPEGTLAAHAWVSVAGRLLIGGDQMSSAYVEMLPNASAARQLTPAK
jgi:hypothetical protein